MPNWAVGPCCCRVVKVSSGKYTDYGRQKKEHFQIVTPGELLFSAARIPPLTIRKQGGGTLEFEMSSLAWMFLVDCDHFFD